MRMWQLVNHAREKTENKNYESWSQKICSFLRLISAVDPDKKSENFQRSNVGRILSMGWSKGRHRGSSCRWMLAALQGENSRCFRLVLTWLLLFWRVLQKSMPKCQRWKNFADKEFLIFPMHKMEFPWEQLTEWIFFIMRLILRSIHKILTQQMHLSKISEWNMFLFTLPPFIIQ